MKDIILDDYLGHILSINLILLRHLAQVIYIPNRPTLHRGTVDRFSTNVSENYVPLDGRGHGTSLAERISRLREHNARDRVSAVHHVVY